MTTIRSTRVRRSFRSEMSSVSERGRKFSPRVSRVYLGINTRRLKSLNTKFRPTKKIINVKSSSSISSLCHFLFGLSFLSLFFVMSNEIKDLNNYHYTSSYNHYNINNQNMINLPYVSGPSTYNANMISSSQVGFDLPLKNLSPQGTFELGFELSPSSSEFFNPSIDQGNGLYNAYSYNSTSHKIQKKNSTSHKNHEVVGGGCATIKSEVRVSASPSSSEADHHPGEDSGKILKKREASDGGEDDQRSQKV